MKDDEQSEFSLAINDPCDVERDEEEQRHESNFDKELWDEKCVDIIKTGNIAKVILVNKQIHKMYNMHWYLAI